MLTPQFKSMQSQPTIKSKFKSRGPVFSLNVEWLIHAYAIETQQNNWHQTSIKLHNMKTLGSAYKLVDLCNLASLIRMNNRVPKSLINERVGSLTNQILLQDTRSTVEVQEDLDNRVKFFISKENDRQERKYLSLINEDSENTPSPIQFYFDKFTSERKQEYPLISDKDLRSQIPLDLPESYFDDERIRRERVTKFDTYLFVGDNMSQTTKESRNNMFPVTITPPEVAFFDFGNVSTRWKNYERVFSQKVVVIPDPSSIMESVSQRISWLAGDLQTEKDVSICLPKDCVPRVIVVSFGEVPELEALKTQSNGKTNEVLSQEYSELVHSYAVTLVEIVDAALGRTTLKLSTTGTVTDVGAQSAESGLSPSPKDLKNEYYTPSDVAAGVEGMYSLLLRFDETALINVEFVQFYIDVLVRVYGTSLVENEIEIDQSSLGALTINKTFHRMIYPQAIIYDGLKAKTHGVDSVFHEVEEKWKDRVEMINSFESLLTVYEPTQLPSENKEEVKAKQQTHKILSQATKVLQENPYDFVTKLMAGSDLSVVETLDILTNRRVWVRSKELESLQNYSSSLRILSEFSESNSNIGSLRLHQKISERLLLPSVSPSLLTGLGSPGTAQDREKYLVDHNLRSALRLKLYNFTITVNNMQASIGNLMAHKRITGVELMCGIIEDLKPSPKMFKDSDFIKYYSISKGESALRKIIMEEIEDLNQALYQRLATDFGWEIASQVIEQQLESSETESEEDERMAELYKNIKIRLPASDVSKKLEEYILEQAKNGRLITCCFEQKVIPEDFEESLEGRPPTPVKKQESSSTTTTKKKMNVSRKLFDDSQGEVNFNKTGAMLETKDTHLKDFSLLTQQEDSEDDEKLNIESWDPFNPRSDNEILLTKQKNWESRLHAEERFNTYVSRFMDGFENARPASVKIQGNESRKETASNSDVLFKPQNIMNYQRAISEMGRLLSYPTPPMEGILSLLNSLELSREVLGVKSHLISEMVTRSYQLSSSNKIANVDWMRKQRELVEQLLADKTQEYSDLELFNYHHNLQPNGKKASKQQLDLFWEQDLFKQELISKSKVRVYFAIQLGKVQNINKAREATGIVNKNPQYLFQQEFLETQDSSQGRDEKIVPIPGTPVSFKADVSKLFSKSEYDYFTPIKPGTPLSVADVKKSASPIKSNQRTAVIPGVGAVDYMSNNPVPIKKMGDPWGRERDSIIDPNIMPVVVDALSFPSLLSIEPRPEEVIYGSEQRHYVQPILKCTAGEVATYYGRRAGLFIMSDVTEFLDDADEVNESDIGDPKFDGIGLEALNLLDNYNTVLGFHNNAPWIQCLKQNAKQSIFESAQQHEPRFSSTPSISKSKFNNKESKSVLLGNQGYILNNIPKLNGLVKFSNADEKVQFETNVTRLMDSLDEAIFLANDHEEKEGFNITDLFEYILPFMQFAKDSSSDRKEMEAYIRLCVRYILYTSVLCRL